MTSQELADKVISKFAVSITDEVFLFIQRDPELMYDYLRTVEKTSLDEVNQTIGKQVKEQFHLDNIGRENKPESTLIQSYEKHKTL